DHTAAEDRSAPFASSGELFEGAGAAEPGDGDQIAGYTILGVLGRGGMGVVYRARQSSPERQVALKVVRPGLATPIALRRFELESEALARLSHPGIASVYEAGREETPDGPRPFFAMELVHGRTLVEHAEVHGLDRRQRLALLARVCDSVQHAHTRGVIHRDLKPANIVVTTGDNGDAPAPKVLDFGVSRLADAPAGNTCQTEAGQLIGTLPYMAPEQIAGAPDVDARADVYALGAIAHELLVGRTPHDLSGKTVYESVRIVNEHDAPRLGTIDPSLRGDVETIVATALAKDAGERYQTAAALAGDIRRWLGHRPIEARPPSALDQMTKFVRRNPLLVGASAAVVVALVGGLVGTGLALERALRAESLARASEARAVAQFERAQEVGGFTRRMITGIDPEVAADRDTSLLREVVDLAAADLDARPPGEPAVEAELRDMVGEVFVSIGRYADAERQLVRSVERWEEAARSEGDSASRTRAMLNLAQLRLEQGRLIESSALLDRVFAGLDGVSDPVLRVRAIEARAGLALSNGDLDATLAGLDEALAIGVPELGEAHPRVLDLVANRGFVLGMTGRADEGEAALRAGIATSVAARGEADAKTLALRGNLATLLTQVGRFDEAEAAGATNVQAAEAVFGADHPRTFLARSNAATLLLERGDAEAALGVLLPMHDAAVRTLGAESPMTLRIARGLGTAQRLTGDTASAEATLRETLRLSEARFGADHAETARQRATLGLLLSESERLGEAERAYRRAIEGLSASLGEGHSETLMLTANLANLLRRDGRLDEAEPLARRALAGQAQAVGGDSFQALAARNALAMILEDAGRDAEAMEHTRLVAEQAPAVLGAENPNGAMFMLRHARTAERAGDAPEALRAARLAEAALASALGAEHELAASAREMVEQLEGASGAGG
ncbi:MAG: serine/threonine-protein kinase, partial [Planctomycetota bacterium]